MLDQSYQLANGPWIDCGIDYCLNGFDLVAMNI